MFNIKNYSPEVSNIRLSQVKLNFYLTEAMNNFNLNKQWHAIFVSLHTPKFACLQLWEIYPLRQIIFTLFFVVVVFIISFEITETLLVNQENSNFFT